MQTTTENARSLEKRLDLAVPMAQIETEVENRLKRLSRTVKLHGFRPGKVPMKLVAQQYGGQVRQEVLGEAVQKTFAEAVREQNLKVAGYPRIEPNFSEKDTQSFEFSATFEVYPEVKVGELGGKTIERPAVTVGDAEVDKTIEILRTQRVRYEAAQRAAAAGDQVTVDYRGTLDGNEFQGGQAKGYKLVLGEGRTLKDFEGGIIGMQAGETKTFEVVFPADYHAQELAGKTAVFEVTLQQVAEAKLPEVDGEFAKSLGVESGDLGAMRAEVKGNLEREVKKRIDARVKDQAMQALLDVTPIEVPTALVDMEIDRLREQAIQSVRPGAKPGDISLPAEMFADQARRRVTLGLILAEVVKANKLEAKPEQVRAMVEEHAQSYEHPEQVLNWYYGQPGRLGEVEALALEENVVAWVLQQAKVVDKPTDFDELMGKA